LNRVFDDIEKWLPLAQDFIEAIDAEAVEESWHPIGRNAFLEQAVCGRPHLGVDARAITVEADEFGFECHGVDRCVVVHTSVGIVD